MRAIEINEQDREFGGNMTGMDSKRFRHDWSSADEWEDRMKAENNAAGILLNQIIDFLKSGGSSINTMTDEDGNTVSEFTFYFNNGNLIGTLSVNTSITNNLDYNTNDISHGPADGYSRESTEYVVTSFVRKLYSHGPLSGKTLVWILTGSLHFTQIKNNNGDWELDEGSQALHVNVARNKSRLLLIFPEDYESHHGYYFKEYLGYIEDYDNIKKSGSVFTYVTVSHHRSLSIKDYEVPVYDMWVFSIIARFQVPTRNSNTIRIDFKYEDKSYGNLGWY